MASSNIQAENRGRTKASSVIAICGCVASSRARSNWVGQVVSGPSETIREFPITMTRSLCSLMSCSRVTREFGVRTSSLSRKPMNSPRALAIPTFRAALGPPFFWRMIVTGGPRPASTCGVSSVEPSSMTRISIESMPCASMLLMARATRAARLYTGSMTLRIGARMLTAVPSDTRWQFERRVPEYQPSLF